MTRVLVVGAGAIGCLYGGLLQLGGLDVTFYSRPDRRAALEDAGIRLSGSLGDRIIAPIKAISDIAGAGPFDAMLLTVKLYDVESALSEVMAALDPGGLLVGVQNGLDVYDRLMAHVPADRAMVGPVYLAARMTGPGAVTVGGGRSSVLLGNRGGHRHPAADTLIEAWTKAGIDARLSDDIRRDLWLKMLVLAPNAALTCLTRQPAGVVYHREPLIEIARMGIAEVAAVARADGVAVTPADEAQALSVLQGMDHDVVASMRQDLDAGRRLELDGLIGAAVRRGAALGVDTPFLRIAYACLLPYIDGASQIGGE